MIYKFRAWDKKGKKWLTDFRITPFGKLLKVEPIKKDIFFHRYEYSHWPFPFEKYIDIMLFTGSLDNQGKEIYEKDILKQVIGYPRTKLIDIKSTIVVWKDGYFQCLYSLKQKDNGYLFCNAISYTHKIIGNLYENSELLSEK